ncbi:MAG: GNAT family N-acetyltransferase [Pseudomonadota bacterium]
MRLELTSPSPEFEDDFMSMVAEFQSIGEHRFVHEDVLMDEGFAAYLDWLDLGRQGKVPKLCPWSAFWARERTSQDFVGMCSIRHSLTPWMQEYGGHIGFRVRPSKRRDGYGTELLSLALGVAADLGIDKALILAEIDNPGSIGVIKKNGGVFERKVTTDGLTLNRYWTRTNDGNCS